MLLLSICFYDGRNSFKFYRSHYDSDISMLKHCFDIILSEKYHQYTMYIHNGSNFDLIFLVEYLLNREGVILPNPLHKDNKFLSLDVQYSVVKDDKTNLCKIKILDSYLLLSNSLSKLGKALNAKTQKDIFPYYFPNKDNFNYVGEVPAYKFFG